MININNLNHVYPDGKVGVKDVNIVIENGDIFGFVGPNGAGKSTTIKSVVGLLPFTSGNISINGHDIKRDPIGAKKEFAYIPDNPDLYGNLSGIQYLNFIADLFGVGEVRAEIIEKYANLFEIKSDLGKLIKSYSHGMKQKLAIISALVHKPRVLILDEPFVGLDPKAAFIVKDIMKEMANEGVSIFFSSHVLEVVEKLCNKIAIIKNGEIVAMGNTDEVKGDSSLETIFMEIAE